MQLTIDSEAIVDKKMSIVEESEGKQVSEIINDIKKDIQNNIEDDLNAKDEEALANVGVSEGNPDIIDVEPEILRNGRDEEKIIPNGVPETPNNNKENDAPRDSEIVVKVVNDIENSTVEIKKNQLISDNIDNENETAATTLIEAKKDDVVNSILNNKLTEKSSESECPVLMPFDEEKNITSEILNLNNVETLNKKAIVNNEQIDDDPVSESSNSINISAANNSEHNPPTSSENDTSSIVAEEIESFNSKKNSERKDSSEIGIDDNKVKNSSKDEVDKSAVVESIGPLELPAETIVLENETTNNIPKEFDETNNLSIDEQTTFKANYQEKSDGELKINETQELTPTEDDNINKENSNQSEIVADLDVNSLNESNSLNDSDQQTQCEKDKERITEDKTILTVENSTIIESNQNISSNKVIDSSTSDAIPTAVEKSSDQKTENKIENETKSDSIGESDSNMSDKDSNDISVEQTNGDSSDNKTIVKNSVVDKLKEPDCVSVSSMEVDDVEIVPTEKINTEIINSQDDAMDISITKDIDNIIEILDQDVGESSNNVEPEKKSVINLDSKKIDQPNTNTIENLEGKADISDEDDIKIIEETKKEEPRVENKPLPVVCKLSNTLDILSDEEDEPPLKVNKSEDKKTEPENKDTFDILSDEEDHPPPNVSKAEDKNRGPENKHILDILSDEEDQPPPKVSKTENKKQERKNKHTLDILSDEEDESPSKISKTEDKKQEPKNKHTLDISDEEDQPPSKVSKIQEPENKQCINIDDDDDIMVIDDAKETTTEVTEAEKEKSQTTPDEVVDETGEKETSKPVEDPSPNINEKESITADVESPKVSEKEASPPKEIKESKPLLPINFLKSAKKNLAEMTRDELEEFCILKIVESIVDRSSLSDIKSKLKTIEKNMDDYRKKAMLLSKQNRDLQVVLKSVQEEQKTKPNSSITPLKITRSVGMQVLMMDKPPKKKPHPQNSTVTPIKPVNRNMAQPARPQRTMSINQNIPVPRLIPASPAKSAPSSPITAAKPPTPNGIRNSVSPAQKVPEKRPLTRQAASSSNMTVDLTDDEPPAKVNKSSPVPPVRLVPSQNLMAPIRAQIPTGNPRKVFIPINGQGHNLVGGQTVMLKSATMGPRQRLPNIPRMSSQVRMNVNRHPAPLPDVTKQYQPPTWKALPPAPDLKLSKVHNGIVISWKIEGYQEDSYEKIASYQLYAYQETSTPPSTALWKKIGDVKALPLPMACTLTQFMAGFKYYFAVRAIDVKSRLGPFSLPGSILLLNKI